MNEHSSSQHIFPCKIMMLFNAAKVGHPILLFRHCLYSSNSISKLVERKEYDQILNILNDPKQSWHNPNSNPFIFLTKYSECRQTRIIDEILKSFIYIKPRSRPRVVYRCLLSYTLQTSRHLPSAFAILQRALRSGCTPLPHTFFFLSRSWLNHCETVPGIVQQMQAIGYALDTGTCNYLISSLCKFERVDEAARVLDGMVLAGCIPDSDTFATLIGRMSWFRMTDGVCEMIKDMVGKFGLNPGQEMLVTALAALRANKEMSRAIQVVEYLESRNAHLGFEAYEVVLEGCLENQHFVLAMKIVTKMTNKGFIPYIKARQKLVQGLTSIGAVKMACSLRHRFSNLK